LETAISAFFFSIVGTRVPNFSAETQGANLYSGEERRTACYLIEGQVQRSVSKLDDDVGLVLKFHNAGLAKRALLVVQAARVYTSWSITMSMCNSSCKINEV
jgi:hypothetical protein